MHTYLHYRYEGLSDKFLSSPIPKLLLLAGTDRLDRFCRLNLAKQFYSSLYIYIYPGFIWITFRDNSQLFIHNSLTYVRYDVPQPRITLEGCSRNAQLETDLKDLLSCSIEIAGVTEDFQSIFNIKWIKFQLGKSRFWWKIKLMKDNIIKQAHGTKIKISLMFGEIWLENAFIWFL